jgi:3-phenylpropionate/cinnamic acid dioxygenase small subunit
VADYAAAIDEKRFHDYEDCFTDDVVLEYSWGSVEGREGLAERVDELLATMSYTQHLITNVRVDFDGDTARGRADFLVTLIKADDPERRFWHEIGYYLHEYRRTGAGWRFSRLETVSKMRFKGQTRPAGRAGGGGARGRGGAGPRAGAGPDAGVPGPPPPGRGGARPPRRCE